MFTFEDSFLWKRRVKIANRAGKFALTRNAKDLMCVDDDPLGTVGCSIIERIKIRDHCNLPSSHVSGSRHKIGIANAVAMIDEDLLTAVTTELPAAVPELRSRCAGVIEARRHVNRSLADVAAAPYEEHLAANVVNSVLELFTAARVLAKSERVRGGPAPDSRTTLQALVTSGVQPGSVAVVPAAGAAFDPFEKTLLERYYPAFIVSPGSGGEVAFDPSFDIFLAIGDRARPEEALPVLEQVEADIE